jgi:hypothetical protein
VWSYNPEGSDLNFHISVCSFFSFLFLPLPPDILLSTLPVTFLQTLIFLRVRNQISCPLKPMDKIIF